MKILLTLLFAGKLGKFLISGGSMLLSVVAYAFVFGWFYAVGFVLLIFCHEMGHYLAARQRGLAVGLPAFIPFVGAWIQLKEQPMDAETEAYVGLAGPLLGSAAAFACFLYAHAGGGPLFLALAYAGFMLNLFNLIPLTPLDGGRIVAAISPKIWLIGLPMLGALFLWRPNPLLLLIALLAAPQVWRVLRHRHDPAYYRVSRAVRVRYALQYLGLAALLAIFALDAHEALPR